MQIQLLCVVLAIVYQISGTSIEPDDSALNHLSTRTPYRYKANYDDSSIKYPGCHEKKIWMMIRHGTRLPSSDDIIAMDSTLKDLKMHILLNYKLAKGKLNKDHIQKFQAWTSELEVEREKVLTLEGQEEMVLLAERMQKRFPGAIKSKYDNKTFLFRYTATERAQQSARFFANGLFERKDAKDVIFEPATKVDLILRFYKHCDRWQKQVKKNPDTYTEQILFGVSPEMNTTLQHVSKVLGFNSTLSLEKVALMYKVCGFETAWNKYYPSPWCDAFDDSSAEVLEYYFDLKHYWADGYGHDLTYRLACMSIKNMFDNLGRESPNATFLFAHSGTLLKIISHLGLYKPDSHLRAENYDLHKNRSWKTTDIDCFASNIAFVLYECSAGDFVLTLHQERPIIMPPCDSELCPLETLTEFYRESIHNCDYSDMCNLDRK